MTECEGCKVRDKIIGAIRAELKGVMECELSVANFLKEYGDFVHKSNQKETPP